MPLVEIPENTWIKELRMDFLKQGLYPGAYGALITFSGGACPSFDFAAKIVQKLLSERFPKRRIVRLTGFMDPSDGDLLLLVKSLADAYGFEVQMISSGEIVYPWAQWVAWNIIRTSRPEVILNSNEIWYEPEVPDDKAPIPELSYPKSSQAILYLKKGLSMKQTLDFICGSKYNWNLL